MELVVKLGQYREEGRDLSPEVYLCSDVDATLRFLPGHCVLQVGKTSVSESSVSEILKKCAPLAIDGWCIYVENSVTGLVYGVFRDQPNPLAVPISEALLSTGSESTKVVRVHQNAPNCVELANYKGDKHTVFLSHKPETEPSPVAFIETLAETICEEIAAELREPTQTFIRRTLTTALEASHGALIAVCRTASVPQGLRDGSILQSPIDFAALVAAASKGSLVERLTLLSQGSLIRGMLGCDGIVVFDRRARLLAYNCFIQPPKSNSGPRSGGARRRAYEALCAKLGRGVYAAFIRSQDGWSEFRKK
ncbi:MAG: hypothetical protein WCF18_11515 [Chthoniobacteraceae bacterium]